MEKESVKETLLEIENIRKEFVGVLALDDVSLSIRKGEVHVIVGENGAGKSTLCKIICGLYPKNSGNLCFEGIDYNPRNVRDAQHTGINMIHQELNLLKHRTVAQNIYVGVEPISNKLLKTINVKKMNSDCKALLTSLGIDYIEPTMLIKNLSIAQQQMVEVAKALSHKSKLLIMDEPTSSLTEREVENLFRLTRKLRDDGVSVVYISHRMNELMEIGDRVTIMRDGKYIGTYNIGEITMDEIIMLMVGRKITKLYNRSFNEPGEEALSVRNLTGLRFRNVNLNVRRGEIVGIGGLIGAGRTELMLSIFGYDAIESGEIYLFGKKVSTKGWNPNKAIAGSMALLPEDRKGLGLILSMPIKANVVQSSLKNMFKSGIIRKKEENEAAEKYVKKLRIVTPSIDQLVENLSGGNQQKVVLAKWLCTNCDLLIFDEPTRGIDVGAKAEIYELMNELAENNCAIIMISSEINEILNLSDRIYVMKDGEIKGEIDHKKDVITQEAVLSLAMTGKAAVNE